MRIASVCSHYDFHVEVNVSFLLLHYHLLSLFKRSQQQHPCYISQRQVSLPKPVPTSSAKSLSHLFTLSLARLASSAYNQLRARSCDAENDDGENGGVLGTVGTAATSEMEWRGRREQQAIVCLECPRRVGVKVRRCEGSRCGSARSRRRKVAKMQDREGGVWRRCEGARVRRCGGAKVRGCGGIK